MKRLFILLFLTLALLLQPLRASAAGSAFFSWNTVNTTVAVGQQTTLTLSLDTQGSETTGADVMLQFDPNIVTVKSVAFSSPNLYNFNFYTINNNQVKLTSSYADVASNFKGISSYATITVEGKAEGQSALSWLCTDGQTNDTNIVKRLTGEDIVNCGGLSAATITVTQTQTTPTASPSPSPTVQPTTNNLQPTTNTCTKPGQPGIISAKAANAGEIHLQWYKGQNASYYSIYYGTTKGNYVYGAGNIGDTDQFLIRGLKAGTLYYIALQSQNDCGASGMSETSSYSGGITGVGVKPIIVPATVKTTSNLLATPAPQTLGQAPTTNIAQLPRYYERSDESLLSTPPPAGGPTPIAFETDKGTKTNFPWWLLFVGAIITFVLILFFIRRRKKEETPTLPNPEIYKP